VKRLGDFLDERAVTAALTARGLSGSEAAGKAHAFARAAEILVALAVGGEGGSERGDTGARRKNAGAVGYFVPGRIEVVGKHTDYGGGRSLLCAVERGFTFLVVPRRDDVIRMRSVDGSSVADFRLDPELRPEMGTWAGYPQTVARRVARNFPSARTGADLAFASDLPRASGMSSSSAMVVAMFNVLSAINGLEGTPEYKANLVTPEDLAGYLGTTENGQTFKTFVGDKGVGTFGGSEDHTAILLSRPGQLVRYAYCPVVHEGTVDFPADHVFAIASSGVIAEKTGAAMASYNRASLLARAVLAEWNRATGRTDSTLADAIRQGGPNARDAVRQVLERSSHPDFPAADLLDRFDQFYAENEEVVAPFARAIQARDWQALAALSDRSQHLTETQLKNQVPQTVFLARTARGLGAVAASAFGAGFGGSVWALVPAADAAAFLSDWKKSYAAEHPDDAARATFFTTRPGPAAFRLG
jgi:galactokinase